MTSKELHQAQPGKIVSPLRLAQGGQVRNYEVREGVLPDDAPADSDTQTFFVIDGFSGEPQLSIGVEQLADQEQTAMVGVEDLTADQNVNPALAGRAISKVLSDLIESPVTTGVLDESATSMSEATIAKVFRQSHALGEYAIAA